MSGTTENRAQPDLRDFGHERHVRYASEGPYIFTCTYLVGCCVRRQNSKFRFTRVCIASSGTMCSSWICYLFYCFFFQIEDLSWKFHSRQESLSHVSILKWKFILWVFNEILHWLQLSRFKPPYAKNEGSKCCYYSCTCRQSSFCSKLHADEANESTQWKMTH